MSIGYAWEKFFSATLTLAQSDVPLTKRLEYAFEVLDRLQMGGGPTGLESRPDLLERFNAICAKMTAKGTYAASAAALSELEAREMAEVIVSILNEIARQRGADDEREEAKRRRNARRLSQ
jgi:hypothetical protein